MEDIAKETLVKILDKIVLYGSFPLQRTINKADIEKLLENLSKRNLKVEEVNFLLLNEIFELVSHEKPEEIDNNKTQSLSDVGMDFKKMTSHLIEGINTLPRKYQFLFRMPKPADDFVESSLAENVLLFTLTEDSKKTYFSGLRILQPLPQVSCGDMFLRVDVRGYVGEAFGYHLRNQDPAFIWKSIVGLFLAFDSLEYASSPWRPTKPEYAFYVYGENNDFIRLLEETTEDENFLSQRKISQESVQDKKLGEIKVADGSFYQAIESIQGLMGKSKNKSVQQGKQRVLNASFWFYEAQKVKFEYLKIMYLVTAFESIVLGGKKESGATTRLVRELVSNTIAKNINEQSTISTDLERLYELRNKIVHGEDFSNFSNKNNDTEEKIIKGLHYLGRYIRNRASLAIT